MRTLLTSFVHIPPLRPEDAPDAPDAPDQPLSVHVQVISRFLELALVSKGPQVARRPEAGL